MDCADAVEEGRRDGLGRNDVADWWRVSVVAKREDGKEVEGHPSRGGRRVGGGDGRI